MKFLVCCHPEILLAWQHDVTTFPPYRAEYKHSTLTHPLKDIGAKERLLTVHDNVCLDAIRVNTFSSHLGLSLLADNHAYTLLKSCMHCTLKMRQRLKSLTSKLAIACSAGIFFGRANILPTKLPCRNSKREESHKEPGEGAGREKRKFFFSPLPPRAQS